MESFALRRRKILEAIGPDAVALIQGGPKENTHSVFRQTNDFYYLCGVETPHAYLLIDGRSDKAVIYLPHQSDRQKDGQGEIPSVENAEKVIAVSGLDEAYGVEQLAGALSKVETIYTPLREGEGVMQSWDTLAAGRQGRYSDPWDGTPDRYARFVELLKSRYPGAAIRDLSPVLNDLRIIKDEGEIELLRRSGKLSALGVNEAMRSTAPGVMEYQLDAAMRYIYLVHGSNDKAYNAIIAGGKNAWYGHYGLNNARLNDGDLVLVDCAPDYQYYASDIGRMWPVNGTYTDEQRQLYGFMVDYHKVYLELIKPGFTDDELRIEAAKRMEKVVDNTTWIKPIYEQAARRALEFPYHMSHPVGLAVHDVGHYRGKKLVPGVVLTLDPQMKVPEERLYIRVEDTLVVTEDGTENFTADAPLELDDVEALMKEEGMVQKYPAFAFPVE